MNRTSRPKVIGRPMKYRDLIMELDNYEIYTPAKIARGAWLRGWTQNDVSRQLFRQRVRVSLARFAANHAFPDEGDGIVALQGQAPTPGWFGWRWKVAAKDHRQVNPGLWRGPARNDDATRGHSPDAGGIK